jgi:regulatory protein
VGASFGGRRRPAREWTPVEVRTYLSRLLARRSWSRQELSDRLRDRGVPLDQADSAIAQLEALGYLDDARYAEGWAQARAERGLGARRIVEELRQKGVERLLAERAVRESFRDVSEAIRAREAARRRLPSLLARGEAQAPARLTNFLLRRGFPPDVVSGVVRSLFSVELSEAP